MKITTLEYIHNALQCEVDYARQTMLGHRDEWLKNGESPEAAQLKHEYDHWRTCLNKAEAALEDFENQDF